MTELENLINQMTKIINLAYEEGYKDALKTDAKEIKVGDKVQTLKDRDMEGTELFPIGTIGKVTRIDGGDDALPYRVEVDNDFWYYSRDMLKVIEREEYNDEV